MRMARATFALVLLSSSMASAAGPRILILESHSDPRPAGMQRYVEAVSSAFDGQAVIAGDELRKGIQASFSTQTLTAGPEAISELVKLANLGSSDYYSGANLSVAAAQIAQAAEGLAHEPLALASDAKLRGVRKEALLTLAQALVKMRKTEEARTILGEVVRSFPEMKAFSEAAVLPKVAELGNAILKERTQRPGTLIIESIPSGRRVVVNDQFVGKTPLSLKGLLAGTYRVFLPSNRPSNHGFSRSTEVHSGKIASVTFEVEIEDRIELEEYVGFRFSTAEERQRFEAVMASNLGKALGADEVLLLSRQRSPSAESELLGAIYDTSEQPGHQFGHRKWGVILPLTPSPDDAALARFALSLKTRRPVDGVQVAQTSAPAAVSGAAPVAGSVQVRDDNPRTLPAWPGWLVAGIGLAGVGGGIGSLVIDGRGTCKPLVQGAQCPQIYTTGGLGIGFLVSGAVLTVAAITWGAVMTARAKRR